PGPARYALPPTVGYINHDYTKPNSPAYSFHNRVPLVPMDSSPGPRYHVGAKVTRFGRIETPSYSILGRGSRPGSKGDVNFPITGELFQTPGPGPTAQKRLHLSTHSADLHPTPSASAPDTALWMPYQHPTGSPKPSSASYSFSSRRKVGAPSEDLSMTPGPGKYNSTNPDIYRHRQPSFSMQSGIRSPITLLLFLARVLTARRSFTHISAKPRPSLWVSDTLSLSPH
ncbi:hypothetical protein INR49_014326, partial [Caranx melampygus]